MPARKVKEPAPKSINLPVPAADPEVLKSAKRMLEQAQALVIRTPQHYESAAEVFQALTDREKEVQARKAELWDPLAKLTKAVQTLFNPPLKVLKQAKDIVGAKMGAYAQEERNIALAAQARANQEAEESRAALLQRAEKAGDRGDSERAYVLEKRAESIQAPTIAADIPHVSGLHLRERWLFEVTDADEVPREYLMVDEKKIRAAVNNSDGTVEIAGVRIWSTLKPQG